MGETLMTEVVGAIAALVVLAVTGGVAFLKKQLDGMNGHKTKHGRTESLYDLACKNDIVQEQMLELVKSVKGNVESQSDRITRLAKAVLVDRKDLQRFKIEVRDRLEKLENSK